MARLVPFLPPPLPLPRLEDLVSGQASPCGRGSEEYSRERMPWTGTPPYLWNRSARLSNLHLSCDNFYHVYVPNPELESRYSPLRLRPGSPPPSIRSCRPSFPFLSFSHHIPYSYFIAVARRLCRLCGFALFPLCAIHAL